MKAITGGKIYFNRKFHENLCVVFDRTISSVDKIDSINSDEIKDFYDLEGGYLIPGFIDVHVHGFNGSDTMDCDESAMENISRSLALQGVTSFLPTTMTMSHQKIRAALKSIRQLQNIQTIRCSQNQETERGAKILGVHLEGPFLNPKYNGAQAESDMCPPESKILDEFGDIIKIITIAPEVEGGLSFIEKYGKQFLFSLGHSACDYDTAMKAYKIGARSTTHLFNAMTSLHHRNPGLSGAALCCDEAFVEIICDNIHIHPDLYRLILKCKGADRIMLITDCIRAGGLCEGYYELGGQQVMVKDGKCTLQNGTIAGSILNMSTALKNFIAFTGTPLEDAVRMTSCNQAIYLGLQDRIGDIAVGLSADFVILDENLRIIRTFVDGRIVDV